jgi:branched-chain amino acid aminotransferase
MQINHDYKADEIGEKIYATLRKNLGGCNIYTRVVLLFDKPGSWVTGEKAKLLIAPMPSSGFNEAKDGLTAKISSWERISGRSLPPRIKAGGNYLNSRLAQLEVRQAGFDMAILLNSEGFVSEAPGSCVFMVRDGVFLTPSVSSSILASITRRVVINIVTQVIGGRFVECDLERIDFYQADEVFLCGTAIEITPVKSIDHISYISNNYTKKIMAAYQQFILGDLKISGSTTSFV